MPLWFNAAANRDSLCKSPQSPFDLSLDWLLTCSIWCITERTLPDHFHEREGDNSVNTFGVIFRVIAWLALTCSIWCSNKKDASRTHIYELDSDSSVYTFAVNFVVVRDYFLLCLEACKAVAETIFIDSSVLTLCRVSKSVIIIQTMETSNGCA